MKLKNLLLATTIAAAGLGTAASHAQTMVGDFYMGVNFSAMTEKASGTIERYRQRSDATSASLDNTFSADYSQTNPLVGLVAGWRADMGGQFAAGIEGGFNASLNSKSFNREADISFEIYDFSLSQLNAHPQLYVKALGGIYVDPAKKMLAFVSAGFNSYKVSNSGVVTFDDGKASKTKFVPSAGLEYRFSETISLRGEFTYADWEENLTQATNITPLVTQVPGSDTLTDTISYSDFMIKHQRKSFINFALLYRF